MRGQTLFVGLGGNLMAAPAKYASPVTYAATVQVYLEDIQKLEISYNRDAQRRWLQQIATEKSKPNGSIDNLPE